MTVHWQCSTIGACRQPCLQPSAFAPKSQDSAGNRCTTGQDLMLCAISPILLQLGGCMGFMMETHNVHNPAFQ